MGNVIAMSFYEVRNQILGLLDQVKAKLIVFQAGYPNIFEMEDLAEILKKHDEYRDLVAQKTEVFR
jgi:hypothetical protein